MERENRPYRWLAEYYDEMFTFHLPWFDSARQRVLGAMLDKVKSACDLCCGTGTTAIALASRGIRMYGVDLSAVMCRRARLKSRATGVPLKVIRADMRDFQLPAPVDLVLCEFDALNHVPRKSDLAAVVKCVAGALRPGGYFYFDVNNLAAFQKIWPGCMYSEKDGVAVVMHGGYDAARQRGVTDVEWFIREGRMWRKRHEHIEQVAWSGTEMRAALRDAGFGRVRGWDATLFFKGSYAKIYPGCRTFYLARKA
jgi:SAM-dependent methyltransferase